MQRIRANEWKELFYLFILFTFFSDKSKRRLSKGADVTVCEKEAEKEKKARTKPFFVKIVLFFVLCVAQVQDDDEVLTSCGASSTLYLTLCCSLNRGNGLRNLPK